MASYRTATTGLILKDIDIGPSTLFCDTSLGVTRPVLPVSWTRPVFNKIHGLSHPGVRPTQKAIAQRFVWHGMKRDIRQWCKECPDCQASKIHRHTHSALTKRPQPSDRFRSLHVDLVGPFPESHGMTYLFTSSTALQNGRRRCPFLTHKLPPALQLCSIIGWHGLGFPKI
ncbi:Pol polyprotein [Plakobranchus ocellatus]|uniref:Pol polyprotein n=1 Tax=Plakobranchus ocellatus TaxID=259542 RepID=A0AAV4AAY8_9GAST|nr:Pol polyprotein [Plakobranchus ocellatus]